MQPSVRFGVGDVRRMLDEVGVRPSRHRGQNFLVDPNVAERIAHLADIQHGDRVLEIGVGVGSLTVVLLAGGARVLGIEVDERLAAVARGHLPSYGLDLRVADATRLDWSAVLDPGITKMVSNLPYSVGTRVLVDLLEQAPQLGRFTVMVQREVGSRLTARPGEDAYGAVSLRVAYFTDARRVARVPSSVFFPRPDVESSLLHLERRPSPPVEVPAERLFAVVDAGFAQRRKTVRNALAARWSADAIDGALHDAAIDGARRAETLDLEEFAALADRLDCVGAA